jgi:hypothetical protein
VRALLAGMGAAEALANPGEARVLAWFPRALYVATPGGIAAFVAPGVEPGPLHVLLDGAPTREAARIGLDGVPAWRGALPDPGSLAAALPLVLEVLDPVASSNLVPAERAAAALLALGKGGKGGKGDLAEAAARLGGAGPGLTPAGDDALGGILFARRALGGDACGDDLVAIASSVRTTEISGAFLLWAARGQALAPVHDLLAAAVTGDVAAATSAARALSSVGHSSGADFAQGLSWGLRLAPGGGSQGTHSKLPALPNLPGRY